MTKKKKTKVKETKTKEEKKLERKNALALLEEPYDEDDEAQKEYIERDKTGRPTKMTQQRLQKLENAFKIGCTDREACIHAGIALQTLYNYAKKFPEFLEQKEDWKENLVIQSRANLAAALTLKRSVSDSWEYLKSKRKAEFAQMKVEAEVEKKLTVKELEDMQNGNFEIEDEE